ncbi:ORF6N domain protein [Bacteroidales bacterium Barb6XT]|nr:ORF6N domain protein [Bacteroidales bacterium Barb6XT]
MMEIVKFEQVREKVITLRDQRVILDSDVAELYGVETRDINKSVKNNPDKFPEGYIFELNKNEKEEVVENFHHLTKIKFSPTLPKAFAEKGLYMLATILKSDKATQTTIAIVETFTKIRELSKTVAEMSESPEQFQQKSLMQKGGEIIADLLGDDLKTSDTETSIELNFAVMKFKHTIKRK